MYIYQLTKEGIDKVKTFKELYEEEIDGIKYVNRMFICLDKDLLKLTLPMEHQKYNGLHLLVDGDCKYVTCNSHSVFSE